jgi:hypothetical protein
MLVRGDGKEKYFGKTVAVAVEDMVEGEAKKKDLKSVDVQMK